MTKALNGLFLLTLIGAFGGMLLNGTSVVVSLLMTGPVAVVAFLVFSFVYFSIAVIFLENRKSCCLRTPSTSIFGVRTR